MRKGIICKTLVAFVIIPLLSSVLMWQTVLADESEKPSHWAEAEISAAIDKGLVPQELQINYQQSIKRYEYVLLANKVFDLSRKELVISDEQPFSDILDHPYESEIIRAYNTGIIKGDGKGNFHPDDNITRQEIASLVVNLLKQVSPDRDFTLKNSYPYNDRNQISDWATYYIDYCYENEILKGYDGNRMDPKGNATIEQSIALMYRLANSEHLLESIYGTLKLSDDSLESDTPAVQIVNQFVETYGTDTFDVIKELSKNQNIAIMSLWEKSAAISVNANTISLNTTDFEKNIFALVHDASDELFISAFSQLLATYNGSEKALQLFNENLPGMKANEDINKSEKTGEFDFFNVETLGDNGTNMVYKISFVQKKQ